MRGRGFSFHGPVNSGEAGGHRSKPEVVLALVEMCLFQDLLPQLSFCIFDTPIYVIHFAVLIGATRSL